MTTSIMILAASRDILSFSARGCRRERRPTRKCKYLIVERHFEQCHDHRHGPLLQLLATIKSKPKGRADCSRVPSLWNDNGHLRLKVTEISRLVGLMGLDYNLTFRPFDTTPVQILISLAPALITIALHEVLLPIAMALHIPFPLKKFGLIGRRDKSAPVQRRQHRLPQSIVTCIR